MLKTDELRDPGSCLSIARDDERLFTLLARDPAAPVAIRAWIEERIRIGKNTRDDEQIQEAADCAARMESERQCINYKSHGGGMGGHDEGDREIGDAVLTFMQRLNAAGLEVE